MCAAAEFVSQRGPERERDERDFIRKHERTNVINLNETFQMKAYQAHFLRARAKKKKRDRERSPEATKFARMEEMGISCLPGITPL